MSGFTDDDVRDLARLARLALDDASVRRLAGELSSIRAFVETLARVDVEGVLPMTTVEAGEGAANALRADDVAAVLGRDALAGGPGYLDGWVCVPKVIE